MDNQNDIVERLSALFLKTTGAMPESVNKLPGSGSYRTYYRMKSQGLSLIGAHNGDLQENEAFISFTEHFRTIGLPVPQVLAVGPGRDIYLLDDLGDTTLFAFLTAGRTRGGIRASRLPEDIMQQYLRVIRWLPRFQVQGRIGLDLSKCYPRAAFDRQSMMWDLNYFKYYYLKLARVPFDEQALEDDFALLCDRLLEAGQDYFLFRDFQSRNIMISGGEPWFIDYQGGRKGALQYDIASLLYDGKADIPEEDRMILLNCYLEELEKVRGPVRASFMKTYYDFVLIRILQALGAYGFRGYYEKKEHFLQSIPYAMRNLQYLRRNGLVAGGLPALGGVIDRMTEAWEATVAGDRASGSGDGSSPDRTSLLTVTIGSFSFRKGIPADNHGNGGGFVFDCRALPNPGRYEEYRPLTGKDEPVILFLEKEPEVGKFLRSVFAIVDQSVEKYVERGFLNLTVLFGCTGGRHRSVYCAGQLKYHLSGKSGVFPEIVHFEEQNWPAGS